jgi:hypothetical protein
MTDDVKNLLSRALGQEPPLRIDRDEVIQQGRKRLRRRRMFEAGGVVAAVMVVAVGAATLTNLDNTDQQMPPAASRTQSAPPGPALPLPQATTTTTTKSPGATSGSPPSAPTQLPIPASFPGAGVLTTSLYNSGVVTSKDVRSLSGPSNNIPGFQREGNTFVYQADVYRSPADEGSLQITVDFTTDTRASCGSVPTGYGECTIMGSGGLPVTVTQWRGTDGERRVLAVTVLGDGTRLAAIASNISGGERNLGKQPDDTPSVLSGDELANMIVKVSFGAG